MDHQTGASRDLLTEILSDIRRSEGLGTASSGGEQRLPPERKNDPSCIAASRNERHNPSYVYQGNQRYGQTDEFIHLARGLPDGNDSGQSQEPGYRAGGVQGHRVVNSEMDGRRPARRVGNGRKGQLADRPTLAARLGWLTTHAASNVAIVVSLCVTLFMLSFNAVMYDDSEPTRFYCKGASKVFERDGPMMPFEVK